MNLSTIQAVIMSAGEPANRILSLWLSRLHLDWRYGSQDYGIDAARDQNVTRFLREDAPRGKQFILMIDHDMVPVIDTNGIISRPGDLLYCGYRDRFGTPGHYGASDFGAACFRASANLLDVMGPPWFVTQWQDGRRVTCECRHFAAKALAKARTAPIMAGTIGHEQRCIILPDETPLGWKLAWPPDLGDK